MGHIVYVAIESVTPKWRCTWEQLTPEIRRSYDLIGQRIQADMGASSLRAYHPAQSDQ